MSLSNNHACLINNTSRYGDLVAQPHTELSLWKLTGKYLRTDLCICISMRLIKTNIYQRIYWDWLILVCRYCDPCTASDVPVYWYQRNMTPDTRPRTPWHCRGGLLCSCFISSWRHAPHCVPASPDSVSITHKTWRGGSVSQNIELSAVFYSVKTSGAKWHVIHVKPAWPWWVMVHWRPGEPLLWWDVTMTPGPGNL